MYCLVQKSTLRITLSFEALNKHGTNKLLESLHHVKSAIKNLAFSSYFSCDQHSFTSGLIKDDLQVVE